MPDQNGFSIGPPKQQSGQGGPEQQSVQGAPQPQPDGNGFSIGPPPSGSSDVGRPNTAISQLPEYKEKSLWQRENDFAEHFTNAAASGLAGTLAGGDRLVHKLGEKIHPGLGEWLTTPIGQKSGQTSESQITGETNSQKALHHLDNIANEPRQGLGGAAGYGGETLMEFMSGDELLKGLSHADQLAAVAKAMKVLEKSPRLMEALRTGAAVSKATLGKLSPEELTILKKYPRIAKVLTESLRAGVVQGAQTTVRSGGDVKEAAKDALGTAATGAVLGTVAHGAASVLRKGGKAAQTITEMNDIAAAAPTSHEVEQGVSDAVNGAFTNETGTLQNNLDDANSTVGMYGEGAPQQSQITAAAQKSAKAGKQAVHDNYQAGLDQLVDMSGDQTIPYEGSPLHKSAQELDAYSPEEAGPLDQPFQVAQPGSPKANALIHRLANFGKATGKAGEEALDPELAQQWADQLGLEDIPMTGTEGDLQPSPELTMQHLVSRRQSLAKMVRDLGPNDRADRAIYGKLLDGIDETIAKLADSVGGEAGEGEEALEGAEGEEVPKSAGRQHLDQMNAEYKTGIRPFQNKDVKNILKGNLNDVAKSIMGGQTSLQDIADVKQALGPQNFQQVARASLQNIVQSFMDESGELDYKKLFQKINKMDPQVRTAMFGDEGKALADALTVANNSTTGLTEIGKQVNELLGNGNIDALLKDPSRVKDIANLVGPDGMKSIGRSIIENQIREASTTLDTKTGKIVPSHFDPDKVLDWWMKMKDSPEVRDALFTVDKESSGHYNDMMKNLAQASSTKKLIKYGVLPVTMGTAGAVHGAGAAFIAALAGLGTEAGFGRARDILDAIANNPRTWKALAWTGRVTNKASKVATPLARRVAAATVYSGLKGALAGSDGP